jgi:hypothetical protein
MNNNKINLNEIIIDEKPSDNTTELNEKKEDE